MKLDPWFLDNLVCPRDYSGLELDCDQLICRHDHSYQVVQGIPIMLLDDVRQTHGVAALSLRQAQLGKNLIADSESTQHNPVTIDPFVQGAISATNGIMYRSLINRLDQYPIPALRMPQGDGQLFLDVGCNWGRWCIAASRKGYSPVGIDPSLEAILSAARVANQLGVRARYLVGDARHLPFRDDLFDIVFSYSVLQHFDKQDARESLGEVRRVLKLECYSTLQMPNAFGIRCLFHQIKRGFREARNFEVRYWRPKELQTTFSQYIGPSSLSVDGFFSLNAQSGEAHLLPWKFRAVVNLSDHLRKVCERFSVLSNLADSLYVISVREKANGQPLSSC